MKIDFARFARLTFAIAAASCDRPPPAVPSHVAAAPADTAGSLEPEPAGPGDPSPAPPPRAEDSPADLSRCASLSPSCEGLIQECQSLAGTGDPGAEGFYPGYRPRIAEEIATCWSASLSPPQCRTPAMGKCVRDAVMRAPIDPTTSPECDQLMAGCSRMGVKPVYSKTDCQKALSSVTGRTREDAARAMGPSGEGCTLEYALPYYPFGNVW